jgi:hypothetical protein
MKFANANKLDRKSGGAERRDLRFHFRGQANVPAMTQAATGLIL